MRFTVLMVSLILATTAVADDKRKPVSVTKEVDKSSPLLMSTGSTGSTDDATQAKAPRDAASGMATGKRQHAAAPRDAASGMATGKRTHAPADGDGGDYNSSRSNKTHGLSTSCTDGKDNDCDGASSAAPANHNTTRSNRTLSVHQPGGSATGQTRSRAQDYNSSRSNTDGVRLDPDSDGDSLREVRCSTRSDECVDAGNGDDPVLRKRPGR